MTRTRNYQPTPLKEEIKLQIDDYRRKNKVSVNYSYLKVSYESRNFSLKNSIYDKYEDLCDVLISNVGLFYSIAPNYFPRNIIVNFKVYSYVINIINLYYKRMGLDGSFLPNIDTIFTDLLCNNSNVNFSKYNSVLSDEKATISLSGGKDSVYALVKSIEKYGKKNVLAVYVDNIMGICPEKEREACSVICDILDVKLETVKFTNSFKKHKGILNGAEIALCIAAVIPIAINFGALNVILGTILSEDNMLKLAPPTFSETLPVLNLFNGFTREIGLNLKTYGIIENTRQPLQYLIEKYPDVMKETVSCMMLSCFLASHRKRVEKNYPDFPFYPRMCGICTKCMTINVYRMKYDTELKSILEKKSVYDYCRRISKALIRKRMDFKPDILDEVDSILNDTLFQYEKNF